MDDVTETGPVAIGDGRYTLQAALGTNETGGVFKAFDRHTRRPCAIKLLDRSATSAQSAERFLAEARALEAVSHPHIVHAWQHGCEGTFCWYAMDLLPSSLRDHVRRKGPLDATLSAAVLFQLLSGLAAVHAMGLVHRDIKLTNLLIDADGRVRLADFGIAHHPDGTVPFETVPGQVLGTPGYGAPEQWAGGDGVVGPAADIFATGVLWYRLLTGKKAERLHMAHYRPQLLDPIPEPVRRVLLRATRVPPQERFSSALEMAEAIAAARDALTSTHEAQGWLTHFDDPTARPSAGWVALRAWFAA